MNTLRLTDNYKRKYGAVFTPLGWAQKIVEKHFFKEWLNGATVLDPTAGSGVFIEAFISLARMNDIELNSENISRLYGVELNEKYIARFFKKIKSFYSVDFPKKNFIHGDILFQKREIVADFLVGNPPWVNFSDLDERYKEKIKPFFIEYGLVANQKDLLLGNARTDISALIILKTLHNNLRKTGKAIFFLPLSLFQNDGANQEFRQYRVKGVDFCVEDIMDFNGEKIFEDILVRYGIANFQRDKKQTFPIKYHILENGIWNTHKAKPLFNLTDPLNVIDSDEIESRLNNFKKIVLAKHLQPRQGVNTCGANHVFFFNSYKLTAGNKVELLNSSGEKLTVHSKFVFPLTVSSTLSKDKPVPEKLILIPHKANGKPIDYEELQAEEEMFLYLSKCKDILQNRKGVLINTWIKKGYWWALLGIGEYSFKPYKIMWKAFGDSNFSPKILTPDNYFGSWQGNQSLNAFIGTATIDEARETHSKLTNPIIQDYLSSLRMQGTCNWAQPGRMKKLIEFV